MSTYCNPLPLPNYPRGRYTFTPDEHIGWIDPGRRDFRETADPTVLYEDGRYILYSSAGMAWTSDDGGATWQHRQVEPNDVGYAPTVVRFGDRYLLTACHAPLYVADNPLGPFREVGGFRAVGGGELEPPKYFGDPMLFADDGRLFLYWGLAHDGIKGVELSPDDPTQAITERAVLFAYNPDHAWERFGEYHEDPTRSYIEGPWMLKAGGRYHLTYTGPGTRFANYAMGTYVADQPLGPFTYPDHNPICASRHGLIRGAGHGCVIRGHSDQLWAFFTCGAQVTHGFERRIGMAPAHLDAQGALRVGPVSELPMPVAGGEADAGLLPVNRTFPMRASSQAPGRDPAYMMDGDLRTWWQPAADDPRPTATARFSGVHRVSAARVAWTEPGLDYAAGRGPEAIAYTLELRDASGAGGDDTPWQVVVDNRGGRDLLIDYRSFEAVVATEARLVIHTPPAYALGLADIAVFGRSAALPKS